MKYILVFVCALIIGTESMIWNFKSTDAIKVMERIFGPMKYETSMNKNNNTCCNYVEDPNLKDNEGDVMDSKNIVRPCDLKDLDCIREYLRKRSKCVPKYGPIPDPVCIPQNTISMPYTNMSMTLTNLMVTGIKNTKIVEFYCNKKTKNVVLALQMKNLNQSSANTYIKYQRTAKEPVVLADFVYIQFKSAIFTAVIPQRDYLRLDMADIHPSLPDNRPDYYIGPNARRCSDPQVRKAFKSFKSNFPTVLQEGITAQANLFTNIYIQNNLCDFA